MGEKVSPSRVALLGSEEREAFTFSMNVVDKAHVHFAGATWPTMQVRKEIDVVAAIDMAVHKQAAAAHQVVHIQATSTHKQVHKKATNAQRAVHRLVAHAHEVVHQQATAAHRVVH
jgi:uncharacterized membrane protein